MQNSTSSPDFQESPKAIGNITLPQIFLSNAEKPSRLLDHALAASETVKNLTQKLITLFIHPSESPAPPQISR